MDYSARWYSPAVGRFTTQDTWKGLSALPQTLNRYAYALNNPINITDPSGHAPCYEDDNGDLRCGYSPNPDDWGNRGGGGGTGSNDDGWTPPDPLPPPNPDEVESPPLPEWMNKDSRIAKLLEQAGLSPQQTSVVLQLLSSGVDNVPVLGNIKSAIEAATGYDLITGEKLGFWDRAVSGATAIIPGGGSLKTALKAGMKTAKTLDKAVTVERRADDIPIGCGNCFTAGTLIETEDGQKPIEEIKVGDKVLSKDDATGKIAYKEVNGTFQRDAEEIYTIQVGTEQLTTTGEHPFYVHQHGWVRTKNLKVGDQLETASGIILDVHDIQVKQETIRVYNFSVQDYHSYFVSDLKVWTHNTKKCSIFNPSHYPNPDPEMTEPPVRYEPVTIDEVVRMRQGKGPTTKKTHGDKNIEAHHRQQIPVSDGGILDELEFSVHRGKGNHTRHKQPSQLTPKQRASEIKEHYKQRGSEYILPGEGI